MPSSNLFLKLKKPQLICLITTVSFLIYFNALFDGFAYDDQYQILGNRWITDIKYVPEIFSRDVWNFENLSSGYYRPLMHVLYMADYYIFGISPWGFHLVNIAVHAAASVLVFIVLLKLSESSNPSRPASYLPSFIAALLFAAHPVHTEAVTWIAGIPDVFFTFFYLLAFYLHIGPRRDSRKMHYILPALSFFAAMLFKETALTLLFILIGYEYAFTRENSFYPRLKRFLPYLLAASIYLILRSAALGGLFPARTPKGPSAFLINTFPLFRRYLGKMLFPVNLTVWHSVPQVSSIYSASWILSFSTAALFLFVLLISVNKNKNVFLALLFILVPLMPALYISGALWQPFSERYLYLPSFGFAVLTAAILSWLENNKPALFISAALVSVIMMTLYSLGTVTRNKIWKDDYTLWSDAVKKAPDESVPQIGLGEALFDKGETDKAIQHFQFALRLNRRLAESTAKDYCRRGIFYRQAGWTDKAIRQFRIALFLKPSYVDAHNNLAMAYEDKGMTAEAVKEYEIALQITRTANPGPR